MSGPVPAGRPAAETTGSVPAPLDVVAVLAALQDQIDDLTATVEAQQATLDAHVRAQHPDNGNGSG